ncbi:hypothetical protein DA075_34510 [Methylobacterium currus]|jgi:hypothetical protein|uniref:Uncharacterized protein n=2 Tax=Methylobacteriaceae TaxID=119045 RepID=A0A2R4WWU9_9HYPH|nr:hypothetical protein DA075_34510 [Methylobacterium currus]
MFLPLALAGSALLSGCSDPPAYLVQPADPRIAVRPPRYTTVVAGVKRYDVVDPKDWRELNRAVTPKPGQGGMEGMDHSKMPGMNGKSGQSGMDGMPGMSKPQGGGASQDGDSMDHSKMPGMNMPGMGGKRDTGGR